LFQIQSRESPLYKYRRLKFSSLNVETPPNKNELFQIQSRESPLYKYRRLKFSSLNVETPPNKKRIVPNSKQGESIIQI
jgi:hypothetical protein